MPFGLMLGTVESAEPDPIRLRVDARVKPNLDLNRLSQVFVVTGGTPPPLLGLFSPPADTSTNRPKPKRPAVIKPTLTIRPALPPDESSEDSP
jgi:cell shape-determining protein MreC